MSGYEDQIEVGLSSPMIRPPGVEIFLTEDAARKLMDALDLLPMARIVGQRHAGAVARLLSRKIFLAMQGVEKPPEYWYELGRRYMDEP